MNNNAGGCNCSNYDWTVKEESDKNDEKNTNRE